MRLKLICCEIFMRVACLAIAKSPHTIDPVFIKITSHNVPADLNKQIQQIIDESQAQRYDAILLCMGLCGNAMIGIRSRNTPLIIPRAHDCSTILLGSSEKFIKYYSHRLSAPWTSICYKERKKIDDEFNKLVEKYGKEDALYIWETMYKSDAVDTEIYISCPEIEDKTYIKKIIEDAEKEGKTIEVLEGDSRLIFDLINGNWNENEFLIVKPAEEIIGEYDYKKVFSTKTY